MSYHAKRFYSYIFQIPIAVRVTKKKKYLFNHIFLDLSTFLL